MDSLTFVILVLYVLAVMRVTRLINKDSITDPIRIAAMRRWGEESTQAYFLQCPWCVSMWLSLISAPFVLSALDLSLWLWPLLAFAASHLTGIGAGLDPEETEIVIEE
jgi:hypothetical protein